MVAFIQKAHGCIFLYDAIEAQEAQLAISDSLPLLSRRRSLHRRAAGSAFVVAPPLPSLSRHR